jgi:hypothetical protein
LELRQLDLELAFPRARVAGEDIEDELGAVEHPAGERGFEVAQLGGAQVVVEEDEIGPHRGGDAGNLFYLAGADQRGRIGTGTTLQQLGGHTATGAGHELTELGERLFGIEPAAGGFFPKRERRGRFYILRG